MAERNIDGLNNELKRFLFAYEEFKSLSLQQLTSNVKRLDNKAGVDTTGFEFEKYTITANEIEFSPTGLPKIISEKLSSGKVSAQIERGQGFLELRLVDSQGKNTVGIELRISRMSETKVTDSGIFLLDHGGELETDSKMEESHGILDQVYNHSEYIRVMTADVVFSKVVDGLLKSGTFEVQQEKTKQGPQAWMNTPGL